MFGVRSSLSHQCYHSRHECNVSKAHQSKSWQYSKTSYVFPLAVITSSGFDQELGRRLFLMGARRIISSYGIFPGAD
jgi:hypothetical protein